MALIAHITAASTDAPISQSALSAFETVHAVIDNLAGVLLSISEEIGPDGISMTGKRLVGAADNLMDQILAQMSAAINLGYKERRS